MYQLQNKIKKYSEIISIPQVTIICSRRFTVGRSTQTPIKNIFSESIIIVDYGGIFIKIIIIIKIRFSEYSALFPKV